MHQSKNITLISPTVLHLPTSIQTYSMLFQILCSMSSTEKKAPYIKYAQSRSLATCQANINLLCLVRRKRKCVKTRDKTVYFCVLTTKSSYMRCFTNIAGVRKYYKKLLYISAMLGNSRYMCALRASTKVMQNKAWSSHDRYLSLSEVDFTPQFSQK